MLERTLRNAQIAFSGTANLKGGNTVDVGMTESLNLSAAA